VIRLKAYLLCTAAYSVDLGAALLVGRRMEDAHPLLVVLVADVAATSIPMIDRRSRERRPGCSEHMTRLPALVPWLPKKAEG